LQSTRNHYHPKLLFFSSELLFKTILPKRRREQIYEPGERGGEGEMYGKSNMETSITVCKIDSQREFALWLRKLKQGLCSKLERWFQK
jgi:hypothetical protein